MVRRWRRVSDLPEANPYVRANSLRLDKNQIMGPPSTLVDGEAGAYAYFRAEELSAGEAGLLKNVENRLPKGGGFLLTGCERHGKPDLQPQRHHASVFVDGAGLCAPTKNTAAQRAIC